MLGFGKKKKKEKNTTEETDPPEKDSSKAGKQQKGKDGTDTGDASEKPAQPEKKKKRFSKKLIVIILLILIAVGTSSYLVYTLYFSSGNSTDSKARYQKLELKYIHLPEEMRQFSFAYFPELYTAMITFNSEMGLFDKEIIRIEAIAQKYPDQKKIADKEKKIWEKAKKSLEKTFLKIEKPVAEIYVLFQVNKELGLTRIDDKKKDLTDLALNALTPAQEMTRKLKTNQTVPRGFIKGNIYKLKKKFL